ncbi:lipopolysaccharide biosynthesis protein [Luteimonas terricola]|uniref:Polysaccharide biosynthesis protein n=1 Tax=Luteimonas terricola TaxID=645597 RepID=A0ABQ2E8D9_9GAMM|nr:oligosaccharide flippase family protein [Luteimonas terricola]GGJ99581.1 hypothetical protein GCM10011394_05910 [Luteimonas terricola]
MAALRINILANYAGHMWIAAIGLVFLPLYTRILGMEAFGLVGLMLSLQAVMQLFDFGIGGTVNRELSRRVYDAAQADNSRDLLRTAETTIWLLAALAALLVWIGSGPMAEHWLHLQTLGRDQAGTAIAIMGVAIALLWPSTFYANCLSGLERQPALNLINAAFATLRYAGVVPVLIWAASTIEAFLWWHAIVGLVQSLVMAVAVWRALPSGKRNARWSALELLRNRSFAGGLFAIGVLSVVITQIDRLALASLRPLEEVGYYTLALSVAAGLGRMVQPMFNALYPRFSRLVSRHDEKTLRELYHLSSQYLAVVIASMTSILIIFSWDILVLWTGDAMVADRVALPMAILVTGTALNGLMNIPYALQLANGWTRLALGLNAVSLVLIIPLCFWAVPRHGMVGASVLWLVPNLISVAMGVPLMHRRLLRGQAVPWLLRDNLPPLLAGLGVALALRALFPVLPRSLSGLAVLALASGLTLLGCALTAPAVRAAMWRRMSSYFDELFQ